MQGGQDVGFTVGEQFSAFFVGFAGVGGQCERQLDPGCAECRSISGCTPVLYQGTGSSGAAFAGDGVALRSGVLKAPQGCGVNHEVGEFKVEFSESDGCRNRHYEKQILHFLMEVVVQR